jgi:hypothetical protein
LYPGESSTSTTCRTTGGGGGLLVVVGGGGGLLVVVGGGGGARVVVGGKYVEATSARTCGSGKGTAGTGYAYPPSSLTSALTKLNAAIITNNSSFILLDFYETTKRIN